MCIFLPGHVFAKENIGRRQFCFLPFRKVTVIRNACVNRGKRVSILKLISSLSSHLVTKFPHFFSPNLSQTSKFCAIQSLSILKSPFRPPILPYIETSSEYEALKPDTALAGAAVLLCVLMPTFSPVL